MNVFVLLMQLTIYMCPALLIMKQYYWVLGYVHLSGFGWNKRYVMLCYVIMLSLVHTLQVRNLVAILYFDVTDDGCKEAHRSEKYAVFQILKNLRSWQHFHVFKSSVEMSVHVFLCKTKILLIWIFLWQVLSSYQSVKALTARFNVLKTF
jgi:hypothetical protein